MRVYKKAILPCGFKANGVACGIKKNNKLDLALFYTDIAGLASCKFTTNRIQAAPVLINKRYLKMNKRYNAIIVNSGNANAFCGIAGLNDAIGMAQETAGALCLKKESVLVASTGIIGKRLGIDNIKNALPELVRGLSRENIDKAKRAIMTTDKFTKEITVKFNSGGRIVTLCGVAKGAGMIAPDMATLLVFILTDANIAQSSLDCAVNNAVTNSFNCITVDGCMSTNDTVIVLANGQAGNKLINSGKELKLFQDALNIVCLELAKLVVEDGEGATKVIRIKVSGANTINEAKKIALSIANSSLFKTAMSASSTNILGRIVASAGAAGVELQESDFKIKFTDLKKQDVDIDVSVGKGKSGTVIYTSDLTHEYVKINAEYN
ncbi:MAG: bifunctional glutamate N-acetyltransferase/amino-acid acetyltransferase ArgJ [Candidatus Omnitrophota bacterium]